MKSTILAIWAISFAICALTVASLNIAFWLSFVAFAVTSVRLQDKKTVKNITSKYNIHGKEI